MCVKEEQITLCRDFAARASEIGSDSKDLFSFRKLRIQKVSKPHMSGRCVWWGCIFQGLQCAWLTMIEVLDLYFCHFDAKTRSLMTLRSIQAVSIICSAHSHVWGGWFECSNESMLNCPQDQTSTRRVPDYNSKIGSLLIFV